jgi:hypothetical protein
MQATIRRTVFLGSFVLVLWLAGRLLLPWLTYSRIVLAVAFIFLAAGASAFVRAHRTVSGTRLALGHERPLIVKGCIYFLVGITWLIVWRFCSR